MLRTAAAADPLRDVSAYRLSDQARSTVAADYQGRAFNSPNDVTVRSDGVIYFTDPNFQRGNRPDQMSGRTSVFRVSGGQVSLVDDRLRQPNGIALSPDGSTLYVGAARCCGSTPTAPCRRTTLRQLRVELRPP